MANSPLLLSLLLLFASAPPLAAWGERGHRMLAAASLRDLPAELAPWFAGEEATVVRHANDPDHWKFRDPQEGPRHFLECQAYGGPAAVPLDQEAARAQLGADRFQRNGQVPWTILDRVQSLARAFAEGDRHQAAYEAGILSHYAGDINVPLHTTRNHNGAETGQHGIHQRWESGLLERITDREGWLPEVRLASLGPASRAAPWFWLQTSFSLVAGVLADDLRAEQAGSVATVDPAYWQAFLALQEGHVKEQLTLSAQRTAEMILLAWTDAGRPPAPQQGLYSSR